MNTIKTVNATISNYRRRILCAGMVLVMVPDLQASATSAQETASGTTVNRQDGFLTERFQAAELPGEESGSRFETDRDSWTPSTRTVEPGRWVLESSYSFIDNREGPERHSFPELLVRQGLSDRIELRLGANYEVGGEGASISGGSGTSLEAGSGIKTEANILYGLKANLTRQNGLRPQSSVLLQGSTPTSGEHTSTEFRLGYVIGWELPGEWTLDSAIRMTVNAEVGDSYNTWAPSVVLRKTIGEKLNLHAEYFGISSQGKEVEFDTPFFSPGIHYLIRPNTEIGLRVGWGLGDDSARFFSNVGVGWLY